MRSAVAGLVVAAVAAVAAFLPTVQGSAAPPRTRAAAPTDVIADRIPRR